MRARSTLLFVVALTAGALLPERAVLAQHLSNSQTPGVALSHHHQWVRIVAAPGRTLRTLVVYPETIMPAHAVLVIHENRGLTDWECQVSDQLAALGYVAVAPDLLSEMGPHRGDTDAFDSSGAARDAINGLPPQQVQDDLDSAVDYASNLPEVDKTVIAAGFSWGGGQAFRLAAHNRALTAALVFYGPAPNDDQLRQLHAPVFGFYGENDVRITGEVPRLKSRLKELGKPFQATTYAGASHAFMRIGEAPDAKPADRKARQAAWQRWKDLLSQL